MLKWAIPPITNWGSGLPLNARFFFSSHHCTSCVLLVGPSFVSGTPVLLPMPPDEPWGST